MKVFISKGITESKHAHEEKDKVTMQGIGRMAQPFWEYLEA